MRVAVTGTPGTGKSTAVDLLDTDLEIIHLNDVIQTAELYEAVDEERDSVIADLDAVNEWLDDRDDVIIDSHLAHHFTADKVVVLRCHPESLKQRLLDRGEVEAKAAENAESEALDVVLAEAVTERGEDSVYELDTTDLEPEAVAAEIEAIIAGEREPRAGEVSFIDYL